MLARVVVVDAGKHVFDLPDDQVSLETRHRYGGGVGALSAVGEARSGPQKLRYVALAQTSAFGDALSSGRQRRPQALAGGEFGDGQRGDLERVGVDLKRADDLASFWRQCAAPVFGLRLKTLTYRFVSAVRQRHSSPLVRLSSAPAHPGKAARYCRSVPSQLLWG